MKKINQVARNTIHSNDRFDVIETIYDCEGKEYSYYTFSENNGFVVILGITDDNKIMMTRQFRIPINGISYEFVGGYIEDGEHPTQAAKREFLEETGYECKKIWHIGTLKAGVNKSNTTGYIYVATNFVKKEKDLDEFEEVVGLESAWVPIEKIPEAIRKGIIIDSTTLAAWSIYKSI